ncbi:MAG: endolytic transglycosylase MltG [Lachnospiraceae bacterium]|nr:endolytic transglycosylase MltG [Lachnospiraceae bacterium]MBP5254790.1 endolytic transglycosylase MltG [Lachnospiraceae bacterium]
MAKLSKKKKEDLTHFLKVLMMALFAVLVILACVSGYRLGRMVFTDKPRTNAAGSHITYVIRIERGESVFSIGMELERAGVIESGLAFLIQSKLYSCRIEAGTYTLSSANSSKEILKYLNSEYVKAHS